LVYTGAAVAFEMIGAMDVTLALSGAAVALVLIRTGFSILATALVFIV